MGKNQQIDDFVNEALLVNEELGEIIASLRKLVLDTYPQAEEEIKYGVWLSLMPTGCSVLFF